jgi:tetratricopeptide (TPR) repeat protein
LLARFDQIAKQVDHDPALAAQVFTYLGGIFAELGMHDEAQRAYQHALDKSDASRPALPTGRLATLAGIASALNSQGRFRETLEFIDGLDLAAPEGTEAARFYARILILKAIANIRVGSYDAATAPLERAQGLIEAHQITDPVLIHQLHAAFAELARSGEDFASAEQHSRNAATHAAEAGDYGAQATLLQNLAIYLGRQGRFEDAQPYFLEAMAIVDRHAPGHPSKLEFAINYAGWLFRTGALESSVDLIRDTLAELTGTPDRHLWAYANRDLATYAFATGDMDVSTRAMLEFMSAAPELYGENSPDAGVAGVMYARYLSLAGFHPASLGVLQQAMDAQPRLGPFDLAAFRAELRIDAGLPDAAIQDYRPGDNPDDPNAAVLDLKFACIQEDYTGLESRVAAIDPANPDESHLHGRLLAWRALMAAALARHDGEDFLPQLESAFITVSETPRLSSLEEWRLMREIAAMYPTVTPMPAEMRSAWNALQSQRIRAREILLAEGPHENIEGLESFALPDAEAEPLPLACLR